MAQIASVAAITGTGKAFAVNEQGVSRELKAGDVLQKGETIRTVGDVQVELLMEDGRLMAVAPNQVLRLDENVSESDQRPTAQDSAVDAPAATADTILQALERGTDLSTELEATAAGVSAGGGADGGSSFVQLLRITEGVDPLTYEYAYTAPGLLPDVQVTSEVLPAAEPPATEPPATEPPATPAPITLERSIRLEEESAGGENPIGNDEDDGLQASQNGNLLGGVAGTLTSITVTGFSPVAIGSQGVTIYFDADGQPIPADSEVEPALVLYVDDSGDYTVTVLRSLNHPDKGIVEETLTLPQVNFTGVTPAGGSITIPLTITVQDDVPDYEGDKQDTLLANAAVGEVTADLGVMVGADIDGADVGIVKPETTDNNVYIKYLDAEGVEKTVVMTVGGKPVSYKATTDGTIVAVYGKDEGIAFTVTGVVNADGSTSYVTNMMAVIDKVQIGSTTTTIPGDEIKAVFGDESGDTVTSSGQGGNSQVVTYTDATTGLTLKISADQDEIVTTTSTGNGNNAAVTEDTVLNTDTNVLNDPNVNWSSGGNGNGGGGGFGVDDNFVTNVVDKHNHQDDGAGERLVVEFYESADNNAARVTVDSATFELDHLGTGETAEVMAMEQSTGTSTVVAGGDAVPVNGVASVGNIANTDGGTAAVHTTVTVDDAASGSTSVVGAAGFDTVYFEAAPGTAYRVGDNISVTYTTEPTTITTPVYADQVWIDFQATIVDGDGDQLADRVDFKVVLDNTGAINGDTVVQSEGSDGLVIQGSAVADVIVGSDGNDIIDGGAGSDTLTGGEGNDIIQINLAESTPGGTDVDVVTDLESGDKIVASDLLVDADGDMTALLPEGSTTTVALDSNGFDVEGGVTQSVVVENVSSDELTVGLLMEGTITIKIDTMTPDPT